MRQIRHFGFKMFSVSLVLAIFFVSDCLFLLLLQSPLMMRWMLFPASFLVSFASLSLFVCHFFLLVFFLLLRFLLQFFNEFFCHWERGREEMPSSVQR